MGCTYSTSTVYTVVYSEVCTRHASIVKLHCPTKCRHAVVSSVPALFGADQPLLALCHQYRTELPLWQWPSNTSTVPSFCVASPMPALCHQYRHCATNLALPLPSLHCVTSTPLILCSINTYIAPPVWHCATNLCSVSPLYVLRHQLGTPIPF